MICRVYWSGVLWVDEEVNTFSEDGGTMTLEQTALVAADLAREAIIDGSMAGFTVIINDKHGHLVDLDARDGTGGEPCVVNTWLETGEQQ